MAKLNLKKFLLKTDLEANKDFIIYPEDDDSVPFTAFGVAFKEVEIEFKPYESQARGNA